MKVFAFFSEHKETKEPVTFFTIAQNKDKAGWPVLELLGSEEACKYKPVEIREICEASTEQPRVLGCIGKNDAKPSTLRD